MKPQLRRLGQFLFSSVALGLALALLLLLFFPALRQHNRLIELAGSWREPAVQSFADAVKRAAPAVANVYTLDLRPGDGDKPTAYRGVGSGVIMTSNGYILTNHHVVADAEQVIVALQDGRTFYASLVGSDGYTDVAVLKIDAEQLPVIPQNDHFTPSVGDLVLAIGNPFNLGQTITQGIISATGRSGMATTRYQDFLQTDAAINSGNSGGALINSRGEMVGLNTLAFHGVSNSDSQGLSFAIPYPLAHRIMAKLIAHGRVIRGYLGINGSDVRQAAAGLERAGGVLVASVDPDGPAAQAGLSRGDLITAISGQRIDSLGQALDLVAESAPATTLPMAILRQGQSLQLNVTIGELAPYNSPELERE